LEKYQESIMKSLTGLVFDIRRFSIHDGPGIRTTVFLKGCPLNCAWCHNPESQSAKKEMVFREERCIHCMACLDACSRGLIDDSLGWSAGHCTFCGDCAAACPAEARQIAGEEKTSAAVLAEIQSDRAFFDQSGGGATFSGGEPLLQPAFLLALLQGCRAEAIHTVLDTSGYASWNVLERVIPYVDLFLYDLKLADEARHQALTGVSNQIILENIRRLSQVGCRIRLRVPVIPGCTDDYENMAALASLAAGLPHVEGVDLLPYHSSGAGKYQRMGREYLLEGREAPGEQVLVDSAAVFESTGLQVRIGG
jgi:pyruvate formate lyase activating enzyme